MATTTTNLKLTKPAVSDAADISVLNANFDKIDALGGFGIGRTASKLIDNNALLSDQVTGGMHYWTGSNTDPNKPFTAGEMLVIPRGGAGYLNQIAFGKDRTIPEIKVRVHTGSWSEWDWLNPPMALGVEYRTTERWQGNPVYTKLLNCGKAVNNGDALLGLDNTCTVIRQAGTVPAAGLALPYNPTSTTNLSVYLAISGGVWHAYFIVSSGYEGKFDVYLQVWYTKG